MFIFAFIFIVIKSFLWLLLAAGIIGLFRVFILGPFKKYQNPIKDISILKKGDIILTGSQSTKDSWYIQISNVLTRKIKHRFWTHAAIYRGESLLWEAQPEGIIEKDIKDYLEGGQIIRAFRHKYIKDENIINNVVKYCEDQKGHKYGFLGLLFYVFSTFMPISFNFIFDNKTIDKWLHLDDAYFCSELIVDAFKAVRFPISPYDGWRVKPSDFISNPLLEEV